VAKHEAIEVISVEASADLSAHQFKFMALSSGQLALQTSSSAANVGVLQDKPAAAGRVGSVAISGRVKVVSGAAVSVGALVMSSTTGKAITATGSGNRVEGLALTASGADGELIEILKFGPYLLA
jgi:hypothetical protein